MMFPLLTGDYRSLSIDIRVRQTLSGHPVESPSTLINWENWDDDMIKFVADCMGGRQKLPLNRHNITQNIAEKRKYENE